VIAEDRLARAFMKSHPARAATSLQQMPIARAVAVLNAVSAAAAATVLREMTVPFASDCLAQLPAADSAGIVAELTMDDATGIVRALQPEQREPLLAALSGELREQLERVLPYPDGTAGAVMDPSVFRITDDVIAADARTRIARAARELLYYVYVVDHANRLVGVLDIPELMLARARAPVSVAMHRDVQSVDVFTPVSTLRKHEGWQLFHAMPVVGDDKELLGAIRYQTMRRIEMEARGRWSDPAGLTAGALAELFQLGTTGLVAGITATASTGRDLDRVAGVDEEAPDVE